MKNFSGKNNGKKNMTGGKIKLLRENAGISRKELAEALSLYGCTMKEDAISRIINC